MSGPRGVSLWMRHKWRKARKHLLHEAAHARHMREDIADPALIQRLDASLASFHQAWEEGDAEKIDARAGDLQEKSRALFPPRNQPKVREWVEVIAVALGVAIGFRTYFFQPYKIPTGSMQPTMWGVTSRSVDEIPGWQRALWFPIWFVTGERPVEVKAPATGQLRQLNQRDDTFFFYRVGDTGKPFRIHSNLRLLVGPDGRVQKGQVIARGMLSSGDQLFVNRIKYNFSRPKRGDITVFATRGIDHPSIDKNQFYIKRLVGLPNETIQIAPDRHLLADGKPVTEPPQFVRQHSMQDGYAGYRPDGQLSTPEGKIELMSDEYLFMGDNTNSSLDGRFFGGVQEDSIVGPATCVFWPLSRMRWAD